MDFYGRHYSGWNQKLISIPSHLSLQEPETSQYSFSTRFSCSAGVFQEEVNVTNQNSKALWKAVFGVTKHIKYNVDLPAYKVQSGFPNSEGFRMY